MDDPDRPRWYAIQTAPRAEWGVHRALDRLGYDTLHLHYAATVRHARRVIGVLKPYFPGYLFAAVVAPLSIHPIAVTAGVVAIVGDLAGPIEIPPAVIGELRSRGDERGLMPLPPAEKQRRELEAGEQVRISAGPLENLLATVALDSGTEVSVWLEMFRGRVIARFDAKQVAATRSPEWRSMS